MITLKKFLKMNNEVLNTYSSTGKIDIEKDKEATKQYFLEEVNVKMRHFLDLEEKLRYFVENGYYEKEFLDKYDFKFIKKMFKKAYGKKFRFPSFMSASKFYGSYAMKSKDGKEILEAYEDRVVITALYLANGNEELAESAVEAIMEAYQPATPTIMNSGKKARGELVSCFLISPDDSMNSISENIGYCLELSRLGGGVGVNLTDLRPLGDPIKGIENRASGMIPVAKLLENSFSYSNQLGQRSGSGVAYLNIFHGDIEEFISSKKPNADEKIRLATLSTGLIIPDIFFELMKKNKDIVLFSPYDIYKEYGIRMSDINITEMYYDLLDNPNIRKLKRINARKLYTEVKKSQFESGYPFEVFIDRVNEQHPLKNIGRIKMSNLCTEITQLQETSNITDMNAPNEYGMDISCNLGSLDIHKATQVEDFDKLVNTSMRLLTSVSDKTEIVNVPSIAKANNLMHSVGLGVMNLHGHLVTQGMLYGSPEAIEFVDKFMEAVNFFSIKASMEIAKETGQKFYRFDESDYATGEYFKEYIEPKDYRTTRKVAKALGNVPVIKPSDWEELAKQVKEHGLYNAYRLATAPTGSISYIRSCTASMAPITEKVEIRDYADSRTIYPMPYMTDDNKHLYLEAYDIDQFRMIDMYASAQKHIDQAISMTLYITGTEYDTERLTKLYAYAQHKNIKSVYYVRQRLQTLEECIACSV